MLLCADFYSGVIQCFAAIVKHLIPFEFYIILLTTLVTDSSLLWEMILWLSVSVIKKKNKAALDTQKGANLGLKCVRMPLAAGLRLDPLGKLQRSPRPLVAIGARTLE